MRMCSRKLVKISNSATAKVPCVKILVLDEKRKTLQVLQGLCLIDSDVFRRQNEDQYIMQVVMLSLIEYNNISTIRLDN